jgi:hypothetical protein
VKEHDLYVPLTYNGGTPIEAKTIERIGQKMLDRFGGVTFFPQLNGATHQSMIAYCWVAPTPHKYLARSRHRTTFASMQLTIDH